MPANPNFKLNFTSKSYKLDNNHSFFIWDVQSPEFSNFHFQIAFIIHEQQNIDFENLKEQFKSSLSPISSANKLFFNPSNKLSFLKKLNLKTQSPKIIQIDGDREHYFKLNKEQLAIEQEYDKKLSELFIFGTVKTKKHTFDLAVRKPKNMSENNPLLSLSILTSHKEKIHKILNLFPTAPEIFTKIINKFKEHTEIDPQNLGIPYREYLSSELHLQHEIKLHTEMLRIIADTLAYLEKPKFLRADSSEKIKIFKELSDMISRKEPLDEMKKLLDSHRRQEALSKHRDPWRFFVLLQGETYSTRQWKILEGKVSEQKTNQPSIVNKLS